MKILFIVPYYKPAYIYGGPIVVTSLLAENLISLGHDVTIYSSTANGESELDVKPNSEMLVDGVKVRYFSRVTKDNTNVSPQLWKHLYQTINDFDVVHIHTWWNFLVLGAALICKSKKIKPVISPHGMLSDYIIYKRHPLAKKWLHKLVGRTLLKNSWLHVSTQMEWAESKKIIPEWQGAIIPNLIRLSDTEFNRVSGPEFNIGFLSRVDPKKGLDVLIRALSYVTVPYKLFIAGTGDCSYIQSLKILSEECGNNDKILWVGWKNGQEKFDFLAQMDLFALISHSENFAVVVLESLSVGTPVLISNNVGLYEYVQEKDFGWVTDMTVENIADQINKLIHEKSKIQRINAEAPSIIKKEYDEAGLTKQYLNLYESTKSGLM